MEITITAFGIAKDIFKTNALLIELEDKCSVDMLKQELERQFPELAKLKSYAIAVNETYASNDLLIKPADKVVIIPPVSGG
jgi:molybdopterin synthase catalytic subunit/molybdopterin synthase sulfur carrier subunit